MRAAHMPAGLVSDRGMARMPWFNLDEIPGMRAIAIGMAVLTLLAIPPGGGAFAGMVDTPACRTDLARANELIHAVRLREPRIKRDDMVLACRLLRENRKDLTEAGKLMEPCLTGHEKGENLGQIWASVGDIREVIQRNCR